jgi:acetyltransferase-like isoleucine patch superfamily enzyme
MKYLINCIGLLLLNAIKRCAVYLKESNFRYQASIHQSVKFVAGAEIYNILGNRDSIQIGANTIVGGHLLTFKHGGKIQIGEWCYVGENSRIWSAASVLIGSRVLVSHNVNIHDTNSHSLNSQERHRHFVAIATSGHPKFVTDLLSAPIVIEDDVWIGCNAIILKGVHIGRSSVVAAGSVVTKDVPEKVLVAGNPARIIREVD